MVEMLSSLPVVREARAVVFLERILMHAPKPYTRTDLLEWTGMMPHLKNVQVAHLVHNAVVHHIEALLEVEGYTSALATSSLRMCASFQSQHQTELLRMSFI